MGETRLGMGTARPMTDNSQQLDRRKGTRNHNHRKEGKHEQKKKTLGLGKGRVKGGAIRRIRQTGA